MKSTYQTLLLLLQERRTAELQTKLEELILETSSRPFKHDADDIWTGVGYPENKEAALNFIDKLTDEHIKSQMPNSVLVERVMSLPYAEPVKHAIMFIIGKAAGATFVMKVKAAEKIAKDFIEHLQSGLDKK